MKKIMVIIVTSVMLFGAGTFADGLKYFDNHQYKKAFAIWEPLAKQGDATAQFFLGLMYCYEVGVEKDLHSCAYWLRKAEENGKDVKRV